MSLDRLHARAAGGGRWRGRDRLILLGGVLLLLGGCLKRYPGQALCDLPPPVYVTIGAMPQTNPDPQGRPLPTVVKVLQLKDSTRLERTTFRELWEKPEEVLMDDLVQTSTFDIEPGTETGHWIERNPKARFFLGMGKFRQPLGYTWRAVYELRPLTEEDCAAQEPASTRGQPRSTDERIRLQLHGYQLDLVTPEAAREVPAGEPTACRAPATPGRDG